MNSIFQSGINYLVKVLWLSAGQILLLFGPLLLLVLFMNIISKQNERLGIKVFTVKGYLVLFGGLGTAIHELGHALFALLFLHKIEEIKLFSLNTKDGTLGYVRHSFNKKSIYQRIGNFFIGIGPILFAAILLYVFVFILFQKAPGKMVDFRVSFDNFTTFEGLKLLFNELFESISSFFQLIFNPQKAVGWKNILLFYLLFSIGSSVTLSSEDVKGAVSGFFTFIGFLIVINLATFWSKDYMTAIIKGSMTFMSVFYFLMVLSIVINFLFLIILLILSALTSLFRKVSSR